ncbi:MAG: cupin domain-containing protein [bacterium]|nr:cupin domain-containing protein [bacterium]MCP4798336.1 cupin domain-containing protein [bacterium]
MLIKKLNEVTKEKVNMDGAVGALKQLVIGSADGAPAFSFRVFTVEPGGHTPRHSHPFEHLNYVLSGNGELVDPDGNGIAVTTGDFAIILPDELHQFRNNSNEDFVFICAVDKAYE